MRDKEPGWRVASDMGITVSVSLVILPVRMSGAEAGGLSENTPSAQTCPNNYTGSLRGDRAMFPDIGDVVRAGGFEGTVVATHDYPEQVLVRFDRLFAEWYEVSEVSVVEPHADSPLLK